MAFKPTGSVWGWGREAGTSPCPLEAKAVLSALAYRGSLILELCVVRVWHYSSTRGEVGSAGLTAQSCLTCSFPTPWPLLSCARECLVLMHYFSKFWLFPVAYETWTRLLCSVLHPQDIDFYQSMGKKKLCWMNGCISKSVKFLCGSFSFFLIEAN